jgi:UDP-N-acetyl-D-glucosamine dehydrogenase
VDPGNPVYGTKNTPKVVGGITAACTAMACQLYTTCIDRTVPVSSPEAAELVKLLENTFRSVNIGLVNEMAIVCDRLGVDVWEVIDAASTKPFGFMKFTPGPGLGGHCIPIDPFYLTWKAREFDMSTRFIEMAGEVNRGMPHWVVDRVMRAFSDRGRGLAGARLLLVGLAYKKNVDDARESPSYKLIELFERAGATVDYHDDYLPVIPPSREHGQYAGRQSQTLERAGAYDAVVISTDHDYVDWAALLERARLIVDTRGVYRQAHPKVIPA